MHQDFIHKAVSGNRYVFLVLALLFSNVLLYEWQIYAKFGQPAPGFLVASLFTLTISAMVVSALLAILISPFVYKQQPFKERCIVLGKFIYLAILTLFCFLMIVVLIGALLRGSF